MNEDRREPLPDLLIVAPMMPFVMEALESGYRTHRLWEMPDQAAFLRLHGPAIRGVATNGGVGLKPDIMAALPALEMVAIYGVGLDAIDLHEAARRELKVSITPDVLTNDVADQGLALLLAVARRVVFGDRYVRAGDWARRGEMALTTRLGGKRAGIVGLGRVGQAVARRLLALEMDVMYTDQQPVAGQPHLFVSSLLALAQEVDILIVAAAGGPQTRQMVNGEVLDALIKRFLKISVSEQKGVKLNRLLAKWETLVKPEGLPDHAQRKTTVATELTGGQSRKIIDVGSDQTPCFLVFKSSRARRKWIPQRHQIK